MKNNREVSNYLLFCAGKFISVIGSAVYTFAIGLYVLKLTGSGLSYAMTLICGYLPIILFAPFSGVLVDKLDKKKIVVITDLLNGLLFISVFAICQITNISLWIVYISTFVSSSLAVLFNTCIESAKPNLVSEEKLIGLNSVSSVINAISNILAPIVGGIVFVLVDIQAYILFNGISFIISALLEIFIDF